MTRRRILISLLTAALFLSIFQVLRAGWFEDGVVICDAPGLQNYPQIVEDGAGGAIITWQENRSFWPDDGAAVCNAPDDQYYPQITTDGASGAIIAWEDRRSGTADIYAQRIDASGTIRWAVDSVGICNATGTQNSVQLTSDGAGGAIFTWHDERSGNYDIYAQRVDAGGIIQWTTDGKIICNEADTQYSPQIISDGTGGAIITWEDSRGVNTDIYAQRIDASGTIQWTTNGKVICDTTGIQTHPRLVSDGAGGAIITWEDARNGNYDIYAQRIDAGGTVQWAPNGILIRDAVGSVNNAQLTSDGAGGAIIAWEYSDDIYAQRIDALGTLQWGTSGVVICNEANDQGDIHIISDDTGGAILAWSDYRSGAHVDIYAQRINASGTVQWTANGEVICNAPLDQTCSQLTTDGVSGAIITWREDGNAVYDIYAQRIDAGGMVRWTANGEVICDEAWYQMAPQLTSDGFGGAIITWHDSRLGTEYDIYAQRIDASGSTQGSLDIYAQQVDEGGTVQWTADGEIICGVAEDQSDPHLTSDGTGGAIIAWTDYRSGTSYDIYAQRIDANGAALWIEHGVVICDATDAQVVLQITLDGVGGAIIAWEDLRSGISDIFAQRVDASGMVQWTPNGVVICNARDIQYDVHLTSDGTGGAIFTWRDYRRGGPEIYAQRINSSGIVQWTPNGVVICDMTGYPNDPELTTDGTGGAIITWWDDRGADSDIYAQRVDAGGTVQWTPNGVVICGALGDQEYPQLTSDGAGGAIFTWEDFQSVFVSDIYAQRIDVGGTVQWPANGVGICDASGNQEDPQLTTDGDGGAIFTWKDLRSGFTSDIYAQRINAFGTVMWTTNGVGICTESASQVQPKLTSNGSGGAIITWRDSRHPTTGPDIYAHHVDTYGYAGQTGIADRTPILPKTLTLLQNAPNPFNEGTHIRFELSEISDVTIEVYDVAGRRIISKRILRARKGMQSYFFDGKDEAGRLLPSGIYFYRLKDGKNVLTKKMVLIR